MWPQAQEPVRLVAWVDGWDWDGMDWGSVDIFVGWGWVINYKRWILDTEFTYGKMELVSVWSQRFAKGQRSRFKCSAGLVEL
jgi:hypothetical protein